MDAILAVILSRAAERGFVIIAGMLAIWIGYRLFQAMPNRREGEGKIELPGGISVYISRVGPGVFFALFGAALIAYSATKQVSYEEKLANAAGTALADERRIVNANEFERGAASCEAPCQPLRQVMAGINADPTIESGGEAAILAKRKLKLAIMRGSWDSAKWGDYQAFQNWVMAADGSAPPATASEAATILGSKP